jgi:hypothetical protein
MIKSLQYFGKNAGNWRKRLDAAIIGPAMLIW